jgi:hypothetical protein
MRNTAASGAPAAVGQGLSRWPQVFLGGIYGQESKVLEGGGMINTLCVLSVGSAEASNRFRDALLSSRQVVLASESERGRHHRCWGAGHQDHRAPEWSRENFRLNTQCSAGNGYFLQAAAESIGIRVEDFANTAFRAQRIPQFSYGCAVFLQADTVNFQRESWQPEEILAGLATVLQKNVFRRPLDERFRPGSYFAAIDTEYETTLPTLFQGCW